MGEDAPDAQDVERAKAYWAAEDVDRVFNRVLVHLDHLKRVLKKNSATDKELVQGLKLLEVLDLSPPVLLVGPGEPLPADSSPLSPSSSSSSSSSRRDSPTPPSNGAAPPAGREEQPAPTPQHTCCKVCLPSLSRTPQSAPLFWGQNPLKVPLLCGFKRLRTLKSPGGGVAPDGERAEDCDVVYKAPCGRSLRDHEAVMRFLSATASYDVLQADFFTFNPSVRLERPAAPGPRRPEMDLSRGVEPTPVELCAGDGAARPDDFRYRRDRWPHGSFLSRGPALFDACCDCTDGCVDARRCACVAMTTGGRSYAHHRLPEPVPGGLYECGPWCGCDRARCQNRLVQRGIRVRLQVFPTADRGWGVRCRDDLDRGTFVCIFAGVILQRVRTPPEPPPLKLARADLPSDDEVEVVTEWLAPPVLTARSDPVETPPTSPPLHVPVIQTTTAPQDRDKGQVEKAVATTTARPCVNGTKRASLAEDVHFLDASREGNVSRFINHSCRPNLFVQNVFTDSHDPAFPVVAFFTASVVKAGAELTWDYFADAPTSSPARQEVACLCGSDACRGVFAVGTLQPPNEREHFSTTV